MDHLDRPAGVGRTISTIRAAINAVGRARWDGEPARRNYVAQERPADVRAILVGGHVIVLEESSAADLSDASHS